MVCELHNVGIAMSCLPPVKLMVNIPPIKMVMNGGWFMTLLYQHYMIIKSVFPTFEGNNVYFIGFHPGGRSTGARTHIHLCSFVMLTGI